jgi:hypothetical protein
MVWGFCYLRIFKKSAIYQWTESTKTKELLNKIETKEFGFVYDKRVILENFDTTPFGY